MTPPDQSLLSFMIGSPQAFIEGARTLRDLWTGSYLVSWLVAKAMKPILDDPALGEKCFVTPYINVGSNALLLAASGKPNSNPSATLPSLPNKFCALVPLHVGSKLRNDCLEAAGNAWREIANKVKLELNEKLFSSSPGWCEHWDDQIDSFLEMVAIVMPLDNSASSNWNKEWDKLGALMEMTRSVKHVPYYRPSGDLFPTKCSLLGSYEQMGPSGLAESREFWSQAADSKGIDGTRLQKPDRLCAVSLVKRFAWPVVLAKETKLDSRILRYSDTATIAAAKWLKEARIDPNEWRTRSKDGNWNGQWLHWQSPDQDTDETCPSDLFDLIQKAKRELGSPPIYYAILHFDGDNMGDLFTRGETTIGIEDGIKHYGKVTQRLTQFGGTVLDVVEKSYYGELIYCGGDDVLAVVPTASAVGCSQELRKAFADTFDGKASLSGGIAVVHYKEDLRYALDVARKSERAAKQSDKRVGSKQVDSKPKKDAVALTVCRHSGDHSSFVIGGGQADGFQSLVSLFHCKISDRWVYKLQEIMPAMEELENEAVKSEMSRLIRRSQNPDPSSTMELDTQVRTLWDDYETEMSTKGRGWTNPQIRESFVTMLRSASFMARGKD